jgi:cytoskeletal protein RodZ
MAKWIIGIIVVGLLGAAVWYSGVLTPKPTDTTTTATSTPQVTEPQPENGMSATTDVSDTALTQDTAAIDAQIKGLNDDSAAVDASTNDKPVTQTY